MATKRSTFLSSEGGRKKDTRRTVIRKVIRKAPVARVHLKLLPVLRLDDARGDDLGELGVLGVKVGVALGRDVALAWPLPTRRPYTYGAHTPFPLAHAFHVATWGSKEGWGTGK